MIIQWRICSHECFILYIVALEVMIEHCVIQSTLHWIIHIRKGSALFTLREPGAEGKGKGFFHFIRISEND